MDDWNDSLSLVSPMNLTQVAERIWLIQKPATSGGTHEANQIKEIESILKEVVEEAEEIGYHKGTEVGYDAAKIMSDKEQAIKEAKVDTYRICAEIAEHSMVNYELWLIENADQPNLKSIEGFITEAIRAKAAEEKA